jgi:DNA-binding transcriptional ArsR family regulator
VARAVLPADLDFAETTPIVSVLVNSQERRLSVTFAALADPTRRALLARLLKHPDLTVGELAQPFDIKLPAIVKHLDVLSDAGLLTRKRVGRTVRCRPKPARLQPAARWIERTTSFWSSRLDNLEAVLEARRARR